MKRIPLTQGLFAQVDDEDFERVSQFKWHARRGHKTFYAARNVPLGGGRQRTQNMHVFLMGTPAGMHTHHVNENGLDNQRENLRILSPVEHKRGERNLRDDNTSGFRGVGFHKRERRWRAQIELNGRNIFCGRFDTAEEAARVRDAKARELGYPEFGMNFPKGSI